MASNAKAIVDHLMQKDAFSQWLGIQVKEVSIGKAVLEMKVRQDMVNGLEVCHGGIGFSLADSALAFAANSHGCISLLVDASVSYPEKIRVGDILTAKAIEKSVSDKLGFYEVEIKNQKDVMVGLFKGTAYRTKKEHQVEHGKQQRLYY